MTPIETIRTRESTHGPFKYTAAIAQQLKDVIANPGDRSEVQREVLDMICSKIARIVVGDPTEPDHWRDIAGYAMLALKELEK